MITATRHKRLLNLNLPLGMRLQLRVTHHEHIYPSPSKRHVLDLRVVFDTPNVE